jgi:hypothetical protein
MNRKFSHFMGLLHCDRFDDLLVYAAAKGYSSEEVIASFYAFGDRLERDCLELSDCYYMLEAWKEENLFCELHCQCFPGRYNSDIKYFRKKRREIDGPPQ